MKYFRFCPAVAVAVAAGAALATLAATNIALADAAPPIGHIAKAATIRIAQTDLGKILVSGSGSTLFMFTKDRRNTDRCVTISGCSSVWPALSVTGKPTVGKGLKRSLVSSIRLRSGARQVTYDGHPLYTYSFGGGSGDTSYVGVSQFGGRWYALGSGGRVVK